MRVLKSSQLLAGGYVLPSLIPYTPMPGCLCSHLRLIVATRIIVTGNQPQPGPESRGDLEYRAGVAGQIRCPLLMRACIVFFSVKAVHTGIFLLYFV